MTRKKRARETVDERFRRQELEKRSKAESRTAADQAIDAMVQRSIRLHGP